MEEENFRVFVHWLARRLDDAYVEASDALSNDISDIARSSEARTLVACRAANRGGRAIVDQSLLWKVRECCLIDTHVDAISLGTDLPRVGAARRIFFLTVDRRQIRFVLHLRGTMYPDGPLRLVTTFPMLGGARVAMDADANAHTVNVAQPDDPTLKFQFGIDFGPRIDDALEYFHGHAFGTRRLAPPGSRKRKREQK